MHSKENHQQNRDNWLNGRKYLQPVRPMRDQYPKYINSSYTQYQNKQKQTWFKNREDPNRHFFQRWRTDGQEAHEKMLNIVNHQRNEKKFFFEKCKLKPQWDTTSHLSEWLSSERTQTTNAGWECGEKEDLHTLLVGM